MSRILFEGFATGVAVALAGTAAGASACSGSLALGLPLAGSSAGTSACSASLGRARLVTG